MIDDANNKSFDCVKLLMTSETNYAGRQYYIKHVVLPTKKKKNSCQFIDVTTNYMDRVQHTDHFLI